MTAAGHFSTGTGNGPEEISAATNIALNGTGIGMAWIVQAETTDAITKVRVRWASRTGTPPTYVLTLETLDTSGNPSGTDVGGGSPTAVTFTPPADTSWNTTIQEFTLTNSWTPSAKSDKFAITIRYSSGTCDASNLSTVSHAMGGVSAASAHFPMRATLAAGSWSKVNGIIGVVAWTTATHTYGKIVLGSYTTATANTAGHRVAGYMTLPSGFGTTFQVEAMTMTCRFGAAAGSLKFAIWNAAGTVMASHTIDADISQNVTQFRYAKIFFDAAATLDYGTKYYYGIEVVSGAVGLSGITCNAADEVAVYPNGANMGLATYDGSTWTESALTYPLFEISFLDITVPSGGGGSALHLGGLGQTGIGAF